MDMLSFSTYRRILPIAMPKCRSCERGQNTTAIQFERLGDRDGPLVVEKKMRSTLVRHALVLAFLLSGLTPDVARGCAPSLSEATPVGKWKTVDDATGNFRSLVTIWEDHGKLYGKIKKILDPSSKDPDPRCSHCQGELRNRPLIGLVVLWDLRKDGAQWSGGKVLDPESGKIYKCFISLEDGGRKLKVRGFVGFSLVGRTQYWLRDGDR
jgi:uncharacterized protein (DUF2147 family)